MSSSGKKLYQLHESGGIWTASPPDHGVWTLRDRNDATKAVAAGAADEFCKLHHGGRIFAHLAAGEVWELIDGSGAVVVVAVGYICTRGIRTGPSGAIPARRACGKSWIRVQKGRSSRQ